jgi:ABC-2 type transport system permease protein
VTAVPPDADSAAGARHQLLHLVAHQFRADLRCFWRNTQSRFFTLLLPVLFLVIFGSVFHNADVDVPGGTINESVYYVPGIIAFGLISAAFSNVAVTVVRAREGGIYKRRRATPLPASAVIAGRALVGVLTALAMTVVLLVIGWAAYGASIPGRTAPAFVLDVIVGAVVFCCLGFAVASLIGNVDTAQPVTLAIVLPLAFISGVFIPASELPSWLVDIGGVFPVRPLAAPCWRPTTRTRQHPGCAGATWLSSLPGARPGSASQCSTSGGFPAATTEPTRASIWGVVTTELRFAEGVQIG